MGPPLLHIVPDGGPLRASPRPRPVTQEYRVRVHKAAAQIRGRGKPATMAANRLRWITHHMSTEALKATKFRIVPKTKMLLALVR